MFQNISSPDLAEVAKHTKKLGKSQYKTKN